MQWEAIGADKNTGREFTITVEAEDQDQATRWAARRGMMVESVRPIDPQDSEVGTTVIQPPVAKQALHRNRPKAKADRPTCRTCGVGELTPKMVYRMSGVVVAIGYVLLIPSIIGVLIAL